MGSFSLITPSPEPSYKQLSVCVLHSQTGVRYRRMLTSSCQAANWEGKASLFKNKSKLSLFFLQPSNSCHVLISELLQDSETKDTIYKHDCGTQGDSEQNKVLLLPENWRDLLLNIVTPWKFIFFFFFFLHPSSPAPRPYQ